MISNQFIKYVPKISEFEEKYSTTAFISKVPFFCSQEGVKPFHDGCTNNYELLGSNLLSDSVNQ